MLPAHLQQELLQQLSADRADYMRYLARRVSSPDDREDIVQQAYGKAVAHIDQLRDASRLRGWFQLILRRSVADFYASKSRERQRTRELEEESERALVALPVVSDAPLGMCRCGESLIADFPEETVELLRRVDLGDESPSEVAPDLGLTANSARVRLHRAHAKLRQDLKDHCAVEGNSYQDFLDCQCTGC